MIVLKRGGKFKIIITNLWMIIPLIWQRAGFRIESNVTYIKESYLDIRADNMNNKQFHKLLV